MLKKIKEYSFLLLVWVAILPLSSCSQKIIKADIEDASKFPIKVLYVGYNPENAVPAQTNRQSDVYYERYKTEYQTRMPAFEGFLNDYFTTVQTVDAREYSADLSDDFDVTIFDQVTNTIEDAVRELDENGEITKYRRPKKIEESFDHATIFIGHTAPRMGGAIGLKLDWYCRCLDADALNINTDHDIFKGPLDVSITMEQKTTPESYDKYPNGKDLPKMMPMWKVQKEGYLEGKGYRVGMVSRGAGFTDSPDTEYISGGVSTKDVGAVALGRHGNFFLWGFSGSPDYMTEEAQKVFVNTVVYMKPFKGKKPLVRKYNERIATRDEFVDIYINLTSRDWYDHYIKLLDDYAISDAKEKEEIRKKKIEGKELTRKEEFLLDQKQDTTRPTWKEYLQKNMRGQYEEFGTNIEAYHKYLTDNRPYFYSEPEGHYLLQVDEDVKQLGISNGNPDLLQTCITMLSNGDRAELAERVLHRYTNENFATTKEWKKWFDDNQDKLFFTEAGGWKWMVNTIDSDQDQSQGILDELKEKVTALKTSFEAPKTNHLDPVSIKSEIVWSENEKQLALVMKAQVMNNWHIYAFVSETTPFLETKILLELPDGITPISDWDKPPYHPYGKNDVYVYKDKLLFVRYFAVDDKLAKGSTLKCGLNYQACDPFKCFPPKIKEESFPL